MPIQELVADRSYAPVYRVSGKADVHAFLVRAVEAAGGTVLYASRHTRAPVFLGIRVEPDERLGLLVYPFRCNPPPIRGRPVDEHRVQVRYGGETSWGDDHPLGRDLAGVDVTLVLGVHLEADLLLGLDPLRYDPLPMGISVEFKNEHVAAVARTGWHAWERENRPGTRRGSSRSLEGLETLIAFAPERLLDYARLEREASGLGLDPPLRLRAAQAALSAPSGAREVPHALEERFALSSRDILEIIDRRMRLRVAVRGGVAEHHLQRHLTSDPDVVEVVALDEDGEPDFEVVLASGRRLRVECKTCSSDVYADGARKVEVQKTRASKGDPASRYYPVGHFDAVAACLYPVTGRWEFRFLASEQLARHERFPNRIQPMQRVDDRWPERLPQALGPNTED